MKKREFASKRQNHFFNIKFCTPFKNCIPKIANCNLEDLPKRICRSTPQNYWAKKIIKEERNSIYVQKYWKHFYLIFFLAKFVPLLSSFSHLNFDRVLEKKNHSSVPWFRFSPPRSGRETPWKTIHVKF